MEQYALYTALKSLLSQYTTQPFTFGFNDMDSNADYDCGIYISGEAPGTARDLQGNYYNRLARVQFLAQSDLSADGNLITAAFMGFIRNLLPTLITTVTVPGLGRNSDGVIMKDPDGTLNPVTLVIVKCDITNDVIPLGKNTQGRMRYSLNALITFAVREVN